MTIFFLILHNYFFLIKSKDDGTVSVHNIDTNPKGEVEEVINNKYLTVFCNIFLTDFLIENFLSHIKIYTGLRICYNNRCRGCFEGVFSL